MSNGPLPIRVDPRKLAERDVQISGETGLERLENLSQALADQEGVISVNLHFSIDQQGIRTITGSAQGGVNMTCQRCLESVQVAVEAEFNLGIAASEEAAKQLPRSYDPLIVEGEEIELLPVIEEELILSLPFDAYHEDCSIETSFGDVEDVAEKTEKTNPFSVLAQLKADNK